MDATATLQMLAEAGFTTTIEAGRIVVRPADRLTDDLRAAIRANRDELAALLNAISEEAEALIGRLRNAAPAHWTNADVSEAQRTVCRDYPAGINCLRALTGGTK